SCSLLAPDADSCLLTECSDSQNSLWVGRSFLRNSGNSAADSSSRLRSALLNRDAASRSLFSCSSVPSSISGGGIVRQRKLSASRRKAFTHCSRRWTPYRSQVASALVRNSATASELGISGAMIFVVMPVLALSIRPICPPIPASWRDAHRNRWRGCRYDAHCSGQHVQAALRWHRDGSPSR